MSSDQDSDAPEDVSFSAGKADALLDLKITKVERSRQQNSLKEWRKKRDAQYKEQKERKLLSMDVLMKADAEIKKRRIVKEKSADEESNDEDYASDRSDSDGSDDEKDEEPGEDTKEEESVAGEGIQEVCIANINAKGPCPLMQAALEFKSRSLYGRGIRRMDMSAVRSRKSKQKATNQIRKEWRKAQKLKSAR